MVVLGLAAGAAVAGSVGMTACIGLSGQAEHSPIMWQEGLRGPGLAARFPPAGSHVAYLSLSYIFLAYLTYS